MGCRSDGRPGGTTKVLALGGSGWIGEDASKQLAESEVVSQVTIGGRNLAAARRLASAIGAKAAAVQVDAMDEDRLTTLASQHDLVVNTAGPDYQVSLPAMRAAIRAGTHCCDISADVPAVERIIALHDDAKASGVTAITGIGTIPGLSNLMMLHAARQFDRLEEVRVCWTFPPMSMASGGAAQTAASWREAGRVGASWETMMRLVAGAVRVYRDGQWIDVDPVKAAESVHLPGGGSITVHPISMTEPITLPRYVRGVRSVSNLLTLYPPRLNDMYLREGQRIARGEVDSAGATLSFLDTIAQDPDYWLARPEDIPSEFLIWVTASGERKGRKSRYTCWPSADWLSTAVPVTLAGLMILQGEIRERGAFPPEGVLEPLPFLTEVARRNKMLPTDGRVLNESLETLG